MKQHSIYLIKIYSQGIVLFLVSKGHFDCKLLTDYYYKDHLDPGLFYMLRITLLICRRVVYLKRLSGAWYYHNIWVCKIVFSFGDKYYFLENFKNIK